MSGSFSSSSQPRFSEWSPERRLATAVVRLAWEDTFAQSCAINPLNALESRKRREEAIQWVMHDRDFIYWCELSAMNARAVRVRFASKLATQDVRA